jgi:peptidoglycan/xylan/chitin deacetylase (PgdA/CDA1 family)
MSRLIKRATSLAARSLAFEKFVTLLEHADSQSPGLLRVLTYHRVDDPNTRPWLDPGLISATPQAFDEQMKYLAAHYNVVSVKDVITAIETRASKDLPSRAVLVTFDDAYCDFEEHAWPILKRHKLPATLFVPTAYPEQPERTFWWDDLYQAIHNNSQIDALVTPIGILSLSNASRYQSYKRLINYLKTLRHSDTLTKVRQYCNELDFHSTTNSVLAWDSLRRLTKEGVTLGAHTRTHPLMNRIHFEEAREEAIGSLHELEREIGSALPIFAYPSGGFSDEVVAMLKREGFLLAFTTIRGINNIKYIDPLRIRRINVGGRTTLPILRAQLLPWTVHLNRLQTILDG